MFNNQAQLHTFHIKDAKGYTLTGKPLYFHNLSVNEDGWEIIGGCTYDARVSTDSCHICVIYGYAQEIGYYKVYGSEDSGSGECWEYGEDQESLENLELSKYPESGDYPEPWDDPEPVENLEPGEYAESGEYMESGEYTEPEEGLEPGEYTESVENLEHVEFLVPEKGYWIMLNGISDQCKITVEAY